MHRIIAKKQKNVKFFTTNINNNMNILPGVQEIHKEMTEWRHDFHMHPELSFEETRTSEIVANKLESFYSQLVNELLNRNIPTLVDADALLPIFNELDKNEVSVANNFVLTPHPKEYARMLNQPISEGINKSDLLNTSKRIKQVLVYKTHKTLVVNGSEIWLSMTGNVALATAGTGDVLSGMIASFLGQGLNAFDASKLGVYMHGLSADIAVESIGVRALLARDVCSYISQAFQELIRGS